MTDGGNFGQVLDEYMRALEGGNPPDREALLAAHPALAAELQAALLGIDLVRGAAPRLALEADAEGPPAASLGDFRILGEIGRGGMGVVYEAEQISLRRRVALKVLPFAAVLDPKHLQRFKNEAMAAAHLRHRNIVPVYGVGCERGVHYYAMQYVEGQSLAAAIGDMKRGGAGEGARSPISSHGSNREPAYVRMVASLGMQAAEALDHAHELGIVHRDVKPGNLLVDSAGNLWITDFGLSHSKKDVGLTNSGELLGTIRYMSPEQALAKRALVDHRTDVYSLGATLYELLTLEPAFPGDDPNLLVRDIAAKEPALPRRLNPALPRDLETVIVKAMSKDPEARYATAQEMADDLGRFLEDRPVEAKRPGPFRRASMWGRRHLGLVGAVAGMLLLAVAGLATGTALLWREQERTSSERDRTKAAFERAEANLRLALRALDGVYLDGGEGHPRIREGLPRDLLRRGLGFYEEFPRENADNPDMALLMGHAHLTASLIFHELGDKDRGEGALDQAISIYREAVARWPEDPRPRLSLGAALVEKGDFDAAKASYQDALRLKPDFAAAHYNLGIVHFEQGDLAGAIALYREAIRLQPDFPRAHYNLGNALSGAGDRAGAVWAYREALRLKPDYAAAHVNLGGALSRAGDEDGAIREYREAIRHEPNVATAHSNLGHALLVQGDRDGAIASYREAIRLQPDVAKTHFGLGVALARSGDRDGAIASYREAIRLHAGDHPLPDAAAAHGNLGDELLARGDCVAAIASYEESIRLAPGRAGTHYALGLALDARDDLDGAMREYHEAIRLQPDHAEAHVNLGIALSRTGDPDGAVREYREAIRLKPDLVQAHFNLGTALSAQGDHDGAIRELREAIRLRPDRAETHDALGKAFAAKGDPRAAIASYRDAIQLEPDLATAHFKLGNTLRAQGEPDAAIASFREAVRLAPGHADARNNLGNALEARGDHEGAIRELREAVRLSPDDATKHSNLGNALDGKGDTEGAISAYRQAIRIKPELADAHYNLGLALGAKGDADGAVASFRQVVRLEPGLASAHCDLGLALEASGDTEGAIASLSEAIRLEQDYAEAYCNLGLTLTRHGRSQEALGWLRKGHEIGSSRPDWACPSGQWIASAERQAGIEDRLDRVLSGGGPRNALERVEFAVALYRKARHAESARMYAEAFAGDAALAEGLTEGHRYNAACSAALASAHGGAEAAPWRGRALEWLRADLAARKEAAADLAPTLEHWKRDPDFAAVRDRLDELPTAEREAWRALWAAVDHALEASPSAAK